MSGYTKIENRLIDWLLEQDVSARQMKLVLFVLRYTVCFHREFAELSLSYIENATGILRRNAQTDIKLLIENNILRERFEGQKRFLALGTVLEFENSKNETVLKIENTSVLDFENSTVLNFENKESKSIKHKDLKNNDQTLFDRFWFSYPRKVSKATAIKAFQRAIKKASMDTVMDGLEHYKQHLLKNATESKYIKHPATWLNAEGWNDSFESDMQPEQESNILRIVRNLSSQEDESERAKLREFYSKRENQEVRDCVRTDRKSV